MKSYKYHAIVLNRRNVSDADRFLTLYTLESGKIDVYAKSVRNIRSKRRSTLDLFSHIHCEVIENSSHRTLTHVDLLNSNYQSKTTLHDISRLFSIGELVDRLTPEGDPHPEVYELLVTALLHLARFDSPAYLTRFKKKLLTLLGFWDDQVPDDKLDAYIDTLLTRPLRTRQTL